MTNIEVKKRLSGFRSAKWEFAAERARQLGFVAMGVVPAGPVHETATGVFSDWLASGYHSGMTYMSRYQTQRSDVTRAEILEGADAVIIVALPYGDGLEQNGFWSYVATYARGRDYHHTMKQRLNFLAARLAEKFPRMIHRTFVDSAPVMERAWAAAAGIGSLTKNGALSVDGVGPRVLLGEIVCKNVTPPEPNKDVPVPFSSCEECRLCLESCPTGALEAPGVVNANLCLSYWSIERNRRFVPPEIAARMTSIFGCDICTTVCPLSPPERTCALEPAPYACENPPNLHELPRTNQEKLKTLISGTPLRRAGVKNLVENAEKVLRTRHGR